MGARVTTCCCQDETIEHEFNDKFSEISTAQYDTAATAATAEMSMQATRSKLQEVGLSPTPVTDKLKNLFDVNLHQEPDAKTNVASYYKLCTNVEMMVTVSCFSVWNTNGKTNRHAKVIPAVPTSMATPKPDNGTGERQLCANGCGRKAATGMPQCCRTCGDSRGRKHGPKCEDAVIAELRAMKRSKSSGPGAGLGHVDSLQQKEDPALGRIRIFFFDDNLNFTGGGADSPGICNLRSVLTGEFVEFGEGKNGFKRANEARHTVVHYSSEYQVVLVQANILDAMEDPCYFTSILSKYSVPGEKLLVFMDVNSTIVCVDTVTGKSMAEILLSTMFEFIELRPKGSSPFDMCWEGRENVHVDKPILLKQLVKKVAKDDKKYYNTFYDKSRCEQFITMVNEKADLYWDTRNAPLNVNNFSDMYEEYLQGAIPNGATETGIVYSWFRCYDYLVRGRHAAVLNTFGVDAHKVIGQTGSQDDVMLITVNHKLWDSRDKKKFEDEYGPMVGRNMSECDAAKSSQMRGLVEKSYSKQLSFSKLDEQLPGLLRRPSKITSSEPVLAPQ